MTLREGPIARLLDPQYMTDEEKADRARRMYEMYADPANPCSLAQVGAAFEGLSRERVRQILQEHGYPIRTSRSTHFAKRRARLRDE